MITKKVVAALQVVTQKLAGVRVKWVLAGSTSLAVQGVRIRPKDIDICTDKRGALLMDRLFSEYCIRPVAFSRSRIFESWFGKFMVDGMLVEVMGDLKVNSRGTWIPRFAGRPKQVNVGGMRVPVRPLQDALKAYHAMGRKKDPYRIRRIREALRRKG